MASSSSTLSGLQTELLHAFFARTQRFFLTGGGALAGFYLHHRNTKDLDLFAPAGVDITDGVRALADAASAIGANSRILQESGDFKRFAVNRGDDLTLVDLVIDRVPQLNTEKVIFGQVRVDPLHEIAANKLCALLDRSEARDLVDLKLLLSRGLELEAVLRDAQRKHMGADPATLSWVLAHVQFSDSIAIPAGVTSTEIDDFRRELVARFSRLALPKE